MNDLDKERQTEGRKAWYAVQTFYCKEEHLGKYLEKKGVNYFIRCDISSMRRLMVKSIGN